MSWDGQIRPMARSRQSRSRRRRLRHMRYCPRWVGRQSDAAATCDESGLWPRESLNGTPRMPHRRATGQSDGLCRGRCAVHPLPRKRPRPVAQFDLPVLGKEEDAADAFRHGPHPRTSRRLGDAPPTPSPTSPTVGISAPRTAPVPASTIRAYFDEHSSDVERAFSIVCMLAGADRKLFADLSQRDYGLDSIDQQDDAPTSTTRPVTARGIGFWPASLDDAQRRNPRSFTTVAPGPLRAPCRRTAPPPNIFEDVARHLRAHFSPSRTAEHPGRSLCDDADAYFDPRPFRDRLLLRLRGTSTRPRRRPPVWSRRIHSRRPGIQLTFACESTARAPKRRGKPAQSPALLRR